MEGKGYITSYTNTWRNVYTGGTSRVGTGTNTKAINFTAGSNVTISYEAAGTGSGQSGNANYFNVKIAATDTTYTNGTGISLSGTTFSLNVAGAKTALGLGSMAYETANNYLTTTTAENTYLTGTSNKNITKNVTNSSNTWGAVGFNEGDNSKFNLYSLRFGSTPDNSFGGNLLAYGTGIMFGGTDTRGFVSLSYNTGHVEFGGGSVSTPTSTVGWHFGINGTDGVTYDLPTIASNAANGNTAYNSLGDYVSISGTETITGTKTFTGGLYLKFANPRVIFQAADGTVHGNIAARSAGVLEFYDLSNYRTVYHSGNSNGSSFPWACSTLTANDAIVTAINTGIAALDTGDSLRKILYLNATNHLIIGNDLKDVPTGGNTYLRGVELHLQTAALGGSWADRLVITSSGAASFSSTVSIASNTTIGGYVSAKAVSFAASPYQASLSAKG